MITEQDILNAYDEVEEDILVDYLLDSNTLGLLVWGIVEDNQAVIDSTVSVLKSMAEAKRYNLAADIAMERDLAGKGG